eukprot:scaffold32823_cov19-Tisochrysis_lutea.AAC.1
MKRARQECPVKTWLESSAKMRLPARDGSYLHTLVVHQLPLGFSGSADHCNEPQQLRQEHFTARFAALDFQVKNSAASLLAPKKEQPPPEPPLRRRQEQLQQEQLRQRDLQRQGLTRVPGADDLLPGLFGRAAGSLLSGAFDMLGSEVGWLVKLIRSTQALLVSAHLAKSSKERETVLDEARRRISNSPAVKQRLGNVQVAPGTCQSCTVYCIGWNQC